MDNDDTKPGSGPTSAQFEEMARLKKIVGDEAFNAIQERVWMSPLM
jgi:hypothetical protein